MIRANGACAVASKGFKSTAAGTKALFMKRSVPRNALRRNRFTRGRNHPRFLHCQKGIFLNQYSSLYEEAYGDLEENEKMEEIVEEEGMNKTGLDFNLYYHRVLNFSRPEAKNEKRMNTISLPAPNAFF